MFNNPYTNPYQHLASLQSQLQNTQQSYPMQQQQYQQPVPNIQQLIQAEVQRQISGMQQTPTLMPPTQQSVSPGQAILSAIGGQLTQSDQMWLSNNLNGLPGFFNTQDGRELVQLAISGYRKHMGVAE